MPTRYLGLPGHEAMFKVLSTDAGSRLDTHTVLIAEVLSTARMLAVQGHSAIRVVFPDGSIVRDVELEVAIMQFRSKVKEPQQSHADLS